MADQPSQLFFEEALKRHDLRLTHVRQALFEILKNAEKPQSVQALAAAIPNAHFVSIYRSVDALTKADIIKQVPQGFKNRYELGDSLHPHHHHATCEVCGESHEINNAEIETLMDKLAVQAGMQPTRHHFELYGICASCSHSSRSVLQ